MRLFSMVRCLLLLFLLVPAAVQAQQRTLVLGILPYLNAHKLYRIYLPVKRYLEQQLQMPVSLATAPNYRVFLQHTERGDYDIVVTAPHFAALAETVAGYRRIARARPMLRGQLVVRADSEIHAVEDLRGRVVALPDRLAIVSMLGEELLRAHGLEPGRDVRLRHTRAVRQPLLLLSRDQSDAAVTVAGTLEEMPRHLQARLRELARTRAVPHLMFMASGRLDSRLIGRIRAVMLEFDQTPLGQHFFRESRLGGLLPITDADMRILEPHVERLITILREP
ncbi:MAG: phosphate/phosphite/phosphonate ABC transporter substrate-binding protein [Gammaproteobacteria bacterium]|nr:MAG: phosphate/phosphite/phosphonate ABC transporter substrate-binding protein [Gammaproteobacteria bacterium]